MSYVAESLETSCALVYLLLTIYFIIIVRMNYLYKDTQAVFHRSYSLLLISDIINYLESLLSITLGILVHNQWYTFSPGAITLFLMVLMLNQSFFIINVLKLYRLVAINKLTTGKYELRSSLRLNSRLKFAWNLKVSLIYVSLTISPRIILYIIHSISHTSSTNFARYILYELLIQSAIECFIILMLIIYIYRSDCDLTLKIEYILYLVSWSCSFLAFETNVEFIFLILLPIRNVIMVMISTVSIYEQQERYTLPLPENIDLDFVLHNEFFTHHMRKCLQEKNDKRLKVLFEVLLDICIFLENDADEYKEIITKHLFEYSSLTGYSPKSVSSDIAECVPYVYTDLYLVFESEFFKEFSESDRFSDIIIEYKSK